MANIGYIQVNRYCNNKCHFCSNPSNWSDISYKRWIDLIDDFINRNYIWVIFTWGEPTLSWDLYKWIKYATLNWIESKVISNWMICSNIDYVMQLKESWLNSINFSFYSYSEKIHDFLTDTPWSYRKLLKAIQNSLKLWIRVNLNCVINKYNQNHLDKTVEFIISNFPQIKHFVWNNLDPKMMRQTDIALSCLPDFEKAWKSLVNALSILDLNNKTYRAERLPLCFMKWFEHSSTETRKIVKQEERIVYFLDNREMVKQEWIYWEHDKLEDCKKCDLNYICSWIYEYKNYYNYVKIKPQKLTKQEKDNIINKIKN